MGKKICEIHDHDFSTLSPLVLWRGYPQVEGTADDQGCDYYWPEHKLNKDNKYEVIAFKYSMKRKDRFTVIYRDESLNPIKQVTVTTLEPIPWDVPFSVRTGRRMD